MRDIIEVVALALGFMSWAMVGVSLQDNQWKKNTGDGGVVITNEIWENLWMACATDSMGTVDCYEFQSMLALPGYIQVCRACMIASAILGAIGVVITLFGMQCSKVADHDQVLKSRLVALGGFCFIMQGLCTVVAAAWYTCSIVYEFFDRFYEGTKFEPGPGLYMGWGSGLLAIFSGSLIMCACNMEPAENSINLPAEPLTRTYQKIHRSPSESTCSNYKVNVYV